ncbi:ribonuclease H-like domain-containing protein [Tanacetum coccineum]
MVDSIVTVLTSLGSQVNDEDLVHYALEGLPDKYNQVCGYMHYRDTFPDLKTVHSLLITKEMRLRSKSSSPSFYSLSASSIVLMTETGISRRPNKPQIKSWRPCYNFARGSCRFGAECRFMHDVHAMPNGNKNGTVSNSVDLITKLLTHLGLNNKPSTSDNSKAPNVPTSLAANPHVKPTLVAYHVTTSPTVLPQSPTYYIIPIPYLAPHPYSFYSSPPGFPPQPAHLLSLAQQFRGRTAHPSVLQPSGIIAQPSTTVAIGITGPTGTPRQETILPHAFTIGTLHDPTTGA